MWLRYSDDEPRDPKGEWTSGGATISGDAVAEHIRQISASSDVNPVIYSHDEALGILGKDKKSRWELKDVPVSSLKVEDDYSPEVARHYADQPAESAPPSVVSSDGVVLDGNHRVIAARLRGDDTVQAYVPVSK